MAGTAGAAGGAGERVSAVIAGAGSGTRLGAAKPKALVELAGVPLIVHAVRGMWQAGIRRVIVTIPADDSARAQFEQVLADGGVSARLVPGGATRQGSVANGLAAVETEFVLIHDAARALTPVSVINRVVAALEAGHDAVVPALAVTDTIKKIDPGAGSAGAGRAGAGGITAADTSIDAAPSVEIVAGTLNRAHLRAMQTPQGFRTEVVRAAHEAGAAMSADEAMSAPDDAALVEATGRPVALVEGSYEGMKVTTAWDLAIAELIVKARGEQ